MTASDTPATRRKRSGRRIAGWLALLALVLQLGLAASHVHAPPPSGTVVADAQHGPDEDDCAVCATLQATSGAVLAAAAPLPTLGTAAFALPAMAPGLGKKRHSPSAPRAPPLA